MLLAVAVAVSVAVAVATVVVFAAAVAATCPYVHNLACCSTSTSGLAAVAGLYTAEREGNNGGEKAPQAPAPAPVSADPSESDQPDVIGDVADSSLVETPETASEAPKPKKPPRKRSPRKKPVEAEAAPVEAPAPSEDSSAAE